MFVPDHAWLPAFSFMAGALLAVLLHRWMLAALPHAPKLSSFDDAPWYMRGNPHITHGYRSGFTWRQVLQSIWTGHNETANIWSHMLGAWAFAALTLRSTIALAVAEAAHSDWVHQLAVVVYCTGATTLLLLSTSFHWIGCVNEHVYALTAKLDYSGIAVLILVSFFPHMYSLFYCHIGWAIFYASCITAITVAALAVSWSPAFSKPGYNWLRAGLFIGMGLFGAVPMPHAVRLIGLHRAWPVFWPMLVMGALYIGGAVLYAMHIPERFWPGRFNFFGHSHFIFHCCVVAAALVHYWNVADGNEWRVRMLGDCSALR